MRRQRVDAGTLLPNDLRAYQWDGVTFLSNATGGLLADEMGLGKTVQAAVALRLAFQNSGCRRALIVVPASLQLNWEQELRLWAPDLVVRRVDGPAIDRMALYRLPIQVLIATYEQVRIDARFLPQEVEFDIVILDEAQRVKNSSSDTSFACRVLPRKRAWALTGTPLENRPSDLVAIFRFLEPGLLTLGMTPDEMHQRIRPCFLRRRKTGVLAELPPITIQDIPLELKGAQLEAYQDEWSSRFDVVFEARSTASTGTMLALLTRLKQLCNYDSVSNQSAKLETLQLSVEELSEPTDKVIVFSQYVQTLDWVSERLDIPHAVFDGRLTMSEREAVIRRFETLPGPRALLMSLKAGGIGLNLNAASTVILFDRWWNPAIENQAIQRAHRFGRTRSLYVQRFLVVHSIEERIAELLKEKQLLFDQYVEDAKNAELDLFSRNDLARLLGVPVDLAVSASSTGT